MTLGIYDGVAPWVMGPCLMLLWNGLYNQKESSVAVTFHPHPRLVLWIKNTKGLFFLSSPEEKIDLLRKTNIVSSD